jgi:hypothetical protein
VAHSAARLPEIFPSVEFEMLVFFFGREFSIDEEILRPDFIFRMKRDANLEESWKQ